MGKESLSSKAEEGQEADNDFDLEDFRNSDWGQIKALVDAIVNMNDREFRNEHWSLCHLLHDKITQVDENLKRTIYGKR